MAYSQYNKIKSNAKGAYTNKSLLKINGGYVTKKQYKFFMKVQSKNYSFEDFVKSKYRFWPYDNSFSINYKYLDYIISFNDISNEFKEILIKCNLEPKRDLPIFNKTKKGKDHNFLLSSDLISKIFSPFLKEYGLYDYMSRDFDTNWFSNLKYVIKKSLRKYYMNYKDSKRDHKFDSYFSKNL